MTRSRYNAFRQPPVSYNYEPLIETLARCREEVERLMRECGDRTPLRHQAQAVILDVEALGRLLPDGAAERIVPARPLHSTR